MAKNNFPYGGRNSYTLQCGTIMILIAIMTATRSAGCMNRLEKI